MTKSEVLQFQGRCHLSSVDLELYEAALMLYLHQEFKEQADAWMESLRERGVHPHIVRSNMSADMEHLSMTVRDTSIPDGAHSSAVFARRVARAPRRAPA